MILFYTAISYFFFLLSSSLGLTMYWRINRIKTEYSFMEQLISAIIFNFIIITSTYLGIGGFVFFIKILQKINLYLTY